MSFCCSIYNRNKEKSFYRRLNYFWLCLARVHIQVLFQLITPTWLSLPLNYSAVIHFIWILLMVEGIWGEISPYLTTQLSMVKVFFVGCQSCETKMIWLQIHSPCNNLKQIPVNTMKNQCSQPLLMLLAKTNFSQKIIEKFQTKPQDIMHCVNTNQCWNFFYVEKISLCFRVWTFLCFSLSFWLQSTLPFSFSALRAATESFIQSKSGGGGKNHIRKKKKYFHAELSVVN